MNFITIDFETATSDRDSPCEVGLTWVVNSQIKDTQSFLIKPYYYPYFDPFNVSIHGIRPQDVSKAPCFDELWIKLAPMLAGNFLIAHNAGFDFSVLRHTLTRYDLPFPNVDYSCSYIFSKKVWQGLAAYDLKSLCRNHGITFQHHRAGADSRACAELSLKAFAQAGVTDKSEFGEKLGTTIGSLYEGGYKPSETKRIYKPTDITKIIGDPTKINTDSLFYQQVVVFTGTLSSMTRSKAQQLVADIGGINGGSVTKTTNFLVVGQQDYRVVGDDGMSSKQEKAIKLIAQGHKIEIMSENDFLRNI